MECDVDFHMHWLTEWCLAANHDCFDNHALEGESICVKKKNKKHLTVCFLDSNKPKNKKNKSTSPLCLLCLHQQTSACQVHPHCICSSVQPVCVHSLTCGAQLRLLSRPPTEVFTCRRLTWLCRRVVPVSCRGDCRLHPGRREHRAGHLHPRPAAVRAARRGLRLRYAVSYSLKPQVTLALLDYHQRYKRIKQG